MDPAIWITLALLLVLFGVLLAVLAVSTFHTATAVTRIADVLQHYLRK